MGKLTALQEKYINEATKAIELSPTADMYYNRAVVYDDFGMFDDAIKDYDEGLKIEPGHPNCFYNRIATLPDIGQREVAYRDCETALKNDPNYAPAYLGKAAIYRLDYEYEEAHLAINSAIDYMPEWSRAYNLQGAIYVGQGRDDEAIDAYLCAIALDDKFATPYCNMGDSFYDQKEYPMAIAYLDKAIGLRKSYSDAYNLKGICYHNMKMYDKAIEQYSTAIELNQRAFYHYTNRADCYKELGRYSDAIKDLQTALPLFKEDKTYQKNTTVSKINKIKELQKSKTAEKDIARHIIDKTESFHSEISQNKTKLLDFVSHRHTVASTENLELTVLRKWNSFTPIIGHSSQSSKGGGYFIKTPTNGIVVDPGFNFVDNFIARDFKFKEIDYVLITHAHNDHTADIDRLLTLLHLYNKELMGGDISKLRMGEKYTENSILDDLMGKHNPKTVDEIEKVRKAAKERFERERKKITFYMTSGTFLKYSGFFDLKEKSSYKIVLVDAEIINNVQLGDVQVSVIKAKHDDIVTDTSSVGFCFEYDEFVLIYTGDTGYWGGYWNDEETYRNFDEKYKGKTVYLLANIGGFHNSENSYSKDSNSEAHYYKNHLGRLGIAKIAERLKPKVCIISEFGEEFYKHRVEIADIYNSVFADAVKDSGESPVVFLPADMGLRINSNGLVRAIVAFESDNNKPPNLGYVCPHKVSVGGDNDKTGGNLFYYETTLGKNTVENIMSTQWEKQFSR